MPLSLLRHCCAPICGHYILLLLASEFLYTRAKLLTAECTNLSMDKQSPPSKAVKVRLIEITTNQAGQRVDNFLFKMCKGVPKSRIYKAFRHGEVRVNKGRVKPAYKLAVGDRVRVPPLVCKASTEITVPDAVVEKCKEAILFESDDLIILNKPAGLAVHKGSDTPYGVIETMRQLRGESSLELVHRLDKATSGCLMIAKHRESLMRTQHALKNKQGIEKIYLALVAGKWPHECERVDAPLVKNQQGSERVSVEVDAKRGKSATTLVSLKRWDSTRGISHIEARPLTGRTHQIRVHCTHQGFPILGDRKYSDSKASRLATTLGVKRLCLHAYRLELSASVLGEKIVVEAPVPQEFSRLAGG